jgi:hypothetical protein
MYELDLNITENTLTSIAEEILVSIVENRASMQTWLNIRHIREILYWGYNLIVKVKGVPPIESIETHLKVEFWAEVKDLDVSIEERIKAAKGLYFMAYVAGLKNVNN